MKWIGQHIWDFISRFRSHVYFEDNVTLSTGKSITMDEYTSGTISITKIQDSGTSFNDNDTSLMTAAAIADKIEGYGYSTTSGDITGVTITTDSGGGSAASDTAGSADFSILGADGVGVTNSGATITAVAVPAEIDHDSLNNFVAAEHYDWSSDISGTATIHANNITDLHGAGVDGSNNQLITDDGDGTVTSEANLQFGNSRLTIGNNTEDIQPYIRMLNDENTLEFGIANGASDFVAGSADGDIVLNSFGDHNVIIAQNDTAALTIDTDGNL